MIISERYRYVFIEVPHTGSVAISKELLEHYDGIEVLRKHATYRDFLRQADSEQRDYFAFAAIRNPLDLAVSRYFRMKTHFRGRWGDAEWVAKRGSIAQKADLRVEQWIERHTASFEEFLLQWYRVPFDSWTSLDRHRYSAVLRFETLASDFDEALRRLGIEPVRALPSANVTPGRQRDWRRYYTVRAIRRAVWVFGPFMDEWGYEFPEDWDNAKTPAWSKAYMQAARAVRSVYWRFLRFRDPRRPHRLSRLDVGK